MKESYRQGLFNPRRWGVDAEKSREQEAYQIVIKKMILKRLFVGLRNAENDTEINQYIYRDSPLDTNLAMGDSVKDFTDWSRGITTPGLGFGSKVVVRP